MGGYKSEVFSVVKAPDQAHQAFDPSEVGSWDVHRFVMIKKLNAARGNQGQVLLMRDLHTDTLIAVKQMPNKWIRDSHKDFIRTHPSAVEKPWQDLGCTKFLNSVGYSFTNMLHGVYRDPEHTYVASSYSQGGDLFDWCQGGLAPGPERELAIAPLVAQIIFGVMQLHTMQMAHRDISLENILADKCDQKAIGSMPAKISLIDFSMATTGSKWQSGVRGKLPYQAPEMHMAGEYDVFLSDVFAVGVAVYGMVAKDYPWLSTRTGGCKCFQYVKKHGFRSFIEKRKLRGATNARVADIMSEPLKQLLEGLLAVDPAQRLTFGCSRDNDAGQDRRSVWDEQWLKTCLDIA